VRHTFRSLRIRNYRLFATGQLISLIGTWMQTVGQDWLVIEQGGRGTALGLVTALQFLPILLIGMYGGDARRPLPRSAASCSPPRSPIAVLRRRDVRARRDGRRTAVDGLRLRRRLRRRDGLDMPARQSFVVEMVGSDDLVNAVSLNSATFNSARLIGPAVAGVMIAKAGVARSS
jgi:hypothetical protein